MLERHRNHAPRGLLVPGAALAAITLSGPAVFAADPPPAKIELTGIVRDFRERTAAGGHPDFERQPDRGFGLYMGNVAPQLGVDMKPRFTGTGWKLQQQYRDALGRPICWTLYDPSLGDTPGQKGGKSTGGITSEATFNQWFRDAPGVNQSMPLTLTFHRQPDGLYVFDDSTDELYSSLGGFFPAENLLFGNPGGYPDHNFHFTFELQAEFKYDSGDAQVFTFLGDDDVWVFIDGRLVIDLGGVHSARAQRVHLDRLGLEDGRTYRLSFFFAERHRTESNFRIQTNLRLESIPLQPVTAAFD